MHAADAVRILVSGVEGEVDPFAQETLATGLSSIVRRLDLSETKDLFVSVQRPPDGLVCKAFASGLSSVAGRRKPTEAQPVCEGAIRFLLRSSPEQPESNTQDCVSILLAQLDPEKAHALAREMAASMCATSPIDPSILSRILADTSRTEITRRAAMMAAATIGQGIEGPLCAFPRIAAEPFPCRLTTQELVELLKMPTCLGGARCVVLDHLGNRYGRRFVNHWAFVRFAEEKGTGLDFTTPPRRPDPKESIKRMLEVLGKPVSGH